MHIPGDCPGGVFIAGQAGESHLRTMWVMPAGKTPRFGNSPCLESEWGNAYFDKLYAFYRLTGMDVLEHDGSYPGDVCASGQAPGHRGLEDSQWNQYQKIKRFYQWCRANGIYLNVPDCYYMAGKHKVGHGLPGKPTGHSPGTSGNN